MLTGFTTASSYATSPQLHLNATATPHASPEGPMNKSFCHRYEENGTKTGFFEFTRKFSC